MGGICCRSNSNFSHAFNYEELLNMVNEEKSYIFNSIGSHNETINELKSLQNISLLELIESFSKKLKAKVSEKPDQNFDKLKNAFDKFFKNFYDFNPKEFHNAHEDIIKYLK